MGRFVVEELWRGWERGAEEFADARLLPVLMRLKELADSNDTRLDDAIRRCSSGVPDTDGGLHYD